MEAKKQLRKPENWQDFESLCKKLWGEIWQCAEIKKNGRSGQNQMGVDIYGIPKGERDYYGIQCKGKDDYSHKKLTQAEIINEIEDAKKFKPVLKKLYLATTATKDSLIEEFVRERNVEHQSKGLFEVHLFSWEDIVDLIDENKETHDWYVRSLGYKSIHAVEVTFRDGSKEMTVSVPFQKVITHHKLKDQIDPFRLSLMGFGSLWNSSSLHFWNSYNESIIRFNICVENKGSAPIEYPKLFLEFNGGLVSVDTCTKGNLFTANVHFRYNTFFDENSNKAEFDPSIAILVQEDSMCTDVICLKPLPEEKEIEILWKLVSKDYKTNGSLKLFVKPEFNVIEKIAVVENENEVRTQESIEDVIT